MLAQYSGDRTNSSQIVFKKLQKNMGCIFHKYESHWNKILILKHITFQKVHTFKLIQYPSQMTAFSHVTHNFFPFIVVLCHF